jgi:DNA-directed RNA polymerase subunit RPC12/RpoP
MSAFRTLFRHCPACGRRFEIRIVKRDVEEGDPQIEEMPPAVVDSSHGLPLPSLILDQMGTEPVMVEEQEFNYTYRCKHCGHQWSEVVERTREERAPEGYKED